MTVFLSLSHKNLWCFEISANQIRARRFRFKIYTAPFLYPLQHSHYSCRVQYQYYTGITSIVKILAHVIDVTWPSNDFVHICKVTLIANSSIISVLECCEHFCLANILKIHLPNIFPFQNPTLSSQSEIDTSRLNSQLLIAILDLGFQNAMTLPLIAHAI